MKHRIFLSTKKTTNLGKAPIYFRILLDDNQVIDKSTSIYVLPAEFERSTKRIIGNHVQANQINSKLNMLSYQLDELAKQNLSKSVATKKIDLIFSGDTKNALKFTFLMVFTEFLKNLKQRIDNGFDDTIKIETFRKNEFIFNNIKSYLLETNNQDLYCHQIDQDFAKGFMNWSRHIKKHSIAHINKQIRLIKCVIRYGVDYGYSSVSNILSIRLKNETKPILFLSNKQFTDLQKLNLGGSKLERIKDLFLLQCYTGLSYMDLDNLSLNSITQDQDGNLFLNYLRGKNGKLAIVPLTTEAFEILNKYKFNLPVLSNQKYNQNLKLIGLMLDLPFELTTHIGRKTCGSYLVNSGVNIFTVKTILGHSSVKTTESHYASMNHAGIGAELKSNKINLANANNAPILTQAS